MATEFSDLLPAIAALADPARRADLCEVANLVGLSPSRVQRVVTETIGESPKRYQLRTRLELGAVLLASSDARIVDVAFATGFASHETFTRAFTNRFGLNPGDWRASREQTLSLESSRNAVSISRCMTLYHRPLTRKEPSMPYDISTKTITAIPVLFQSKTATRDELGEVLAECLPMVFGYVMENGLAPAGHPFVRYNNMTPGLTFDIDAGIPLVEAPAKLPPQESEIFAGELLGGPVATTVHKGSYESLSDAYAALEKWVAESTATAVGAPWEIYLTDPGEVPDPANWLTEVFMPISGTE